MDIEGAFNNVSVESIEQAIVDSCRDRSITRWILAVFRTRSISAELNDCIMVKSVNRGTPQGGVLSPLIWLLVMDKILKELKKSRIKAVAYADDAKKTFVHFETLLYRNENKNYLYKRKIMFRIFHLKNYAKYVEL